MGRGFLVALALTLTAPLQAQSITAVLEGARATVAVAPRPQPVVLCDATHLCPGDDVNQIIASGAAGTVYHFAPGVYRGVQVAPKSRMQLIGAPGVLWKGSIVVGGFSGSTASLPRAPGPVFGQCDGSHPLCGMPEDLFLDGVLQTRVAAGATVPAGSWSYDYATLRLGSPPDGHVVELSVVPYAIKGTGATGSPQDVVVRHITMEQYASPAQGGVLWLEASAKRWVFDSNEVRWGHGGCVRAGFKSHIGWNLIHHCGQEGYNGFKPDSTTFEGNEIAYNGWAGFNCGWECGGGKFSNSVGVRLLNNWSHHNSGPGMWTDVDNVGCLYRGNRVEDNVGSGIFHEISYRCRITGNIALRNGLGSGHNSVMSGAGILIANSDDTEVDSNTVLGNWHGIGGRMQNRGSSATFGGAYTLRNANVHDNVIGVPSCSAATRAAAGFTEDDGASNVWSSAWNNRFARNTYQVPSGAQCWVWNGAGQTFAAWTMLGLQ